MKSEARSAKRAAGKRAMSAIVLAGAVLAPVPRAFSGMGQGAAPGETPRFQANHGGILATIIQSGSTNARGYKVVIRNDGSAAADIAPLARLRPSGTPESSQEFRPETVDVAALRHLLARVGDVSRIPTGGCPKSVSFGTTTSINYEGRTSGDLQCIRPAPGSDPGLAQASEELGKFVQALLRQLRINTRRAVEQP